MHQPTTGTPCTCRPGIARDNCPACEGTGARIDFAAIRAHHQTEPGEPQAMTTRRKPAPGTVSYGTMRPEDLIPAFLSVAEAHRLSRADRQTVREIRARVNQTETTATRPAYDYDSEEADQDLTDLFDILDTIAPAGHYFGAHPGDGADFGFWQHEEG